MIYLFLQPKVIIKPLGEWLKWSRVGFGLLHSAFT